MPLNSPALRGERGVAAGEDEREAVVGDRAHVVLLGRQRLEPGEQLGLAGECLLAPEPVDRAVARGGDDPGARARRRPVARPALERDREGVLHRVLGELEVAEDAGECCDGTAPFLPEDAADVRGQCSMTGLSSTDGAEDDRDAGRDRDRRVQVLGLDLHQPADLLLRLGEGTVRDERLAVADADGPGGLRAVELVAGSERAAGAELAEERLPLRHLLGPRGRGLLGRHRLPGGDGVGVVRQQGCVLHDCSPPSTWTGRTSIAPCFAAGIFAAHVHASSNESHSKT